MKAAVEITVNPQLAAAEPKLPAILRRFADRLNALSPSELEMVLKTVADALDQAEEPVPEHSVVRLLSTGHKPAAEERVGSEIDLLMQSFARRRELLTGSLTASEVAKLLRTTRQTPHDRRKAGSLLAVLDRGVWRFPGWQFDPEGEQGVVPGLPAVIRALGVSPVAKLSWLTRPNPFLDEDTPLACLKSGQTDRVVALARSVGVA